MRLEGGFAFGDVARADRPPLDLVASEQFGPPQPRTPRRASSRVDRVPMPVFMPKRAGRRKLVRGVAREEHAPFAVAVRDELRRIQGMLETDLSSNGSADGALSAASMSASP